MSQNQSNSQDQNNSMSDHAWKYFEFHANQRIVLLRFYIAILVFYSGAVGFLFIRFYQPGPLAEIAVIFLSIAFIILTIMFQLLDARNCQLFGYAKKALMSIESNFSPQNKALKIFTLEKVECDNGQSKTTHKMCFTAIYWLAYGTCIVAILVSIVSCCYFSRCSG